MSLSVREQESQIAFLTNWLSEENPQGVTGEQLEQLTQKHQSELMQRQGKAAQVTHQVFSDQVKGAEVDGFYSEVKSKVSLLKDKVQAVTSDQTQMGEDVAVGRKKLGDAKQQQQEKQKELEEAQKMLRAMIANIKV